MIQFDETTKKMLKEMHGVKECEVCLEDGRNSAKESLAILAREISGAYEYMKNFDCRVNCEPEVDFHEPECQIALAFKEAIAAVKARGDWPLEKK